MVRTFLRWRSAPVLAVGLLALLAFSLFSLRGGGSSLSGTAAVAAMSIVAGNNQQAERQLIPGTNIGAATFQPLKVAVYSGGGRGMPLAGATVTFSCNGGGLSCEVGVLPSGLATNTLPVVSDGAGVATLPAVTAGATSAGPVTVTATSGATSVTFNLTVIAPASNVSQGKHATTSSVYGGTNCNPMAPLAVDGNTNGNYNACTMTHTNNEAQPWWRVDLLGTYTLSRIVLWNRTDCCGDRLSNFNVSVSADAQNWTAVHTQPGAAGASLTIETPGRTARYVKVQLTGTGYLGLAEVQVFGNQVPGTPTFPLPDLSYVADLTVVMSGASNVGCPGGYRRVNQDLNQGAGGDFIYACLKPGTREEALTFVGSTITTCQSPPYYSFETVPGDLNRDAGGATLNFCKGRGNWNVPLQNLSNWPIRDIAFSVLDENHTVTACTSYHGFSNGWDFAPPLPVSITTRPGPDGWPHYVVTHHHEWWGDLNYGAGGKFIFACIKR